MKSCDVDKMFLVELYKAIIHKAERHKIIVPIFQRGKCWSQDEERDFIESVRKGLPFGSMLFYRKSINGETVDILIDGLQRSNTIKKYMEHPLRFISDESISMEMLQNILNVINCEISDENCDLLKLKILSFFAESCSLNEIESSDVTDVILTCFNIVPTYDISRKVQNIVRPYIKVLQAEYEDVSKVVVPIVTYEGPEENLPIIFNKINSKGVELDDLEIYAATWPTIRNGKINNEKIVNYVLKKYDCLTNDGFELESYNPNDLRIYKNLTPFEYVFGLGKFLTNQYPFLSFMEKNEKEDTINSLGFELLNVCLNSNKKKRDYLYENLLSLDINLLENCLINAIEFVGDKIKLITAFKGNTRTDKSVKFHGKYHIMSLIANTFREMYDINDLTDYRPTWKETRSTMGKNIVQYYIYDILHKTWSDGSPSKIYTFISPNRYLSSIPYAMWNICLESYYESNNMIPSKMEPTKEDKLVLNVIYLKLFSYFDHASDIKFDIEHLATKDLMKKIKKDTRNDSLVIGSIGNLCYLPEGTNREKGSKTIYQYNKIKEKLHEIEDKYSFTIEDDLQWVDQNYSIDDTNKISDIYYEYLRHRFDKQKKLFFETLDIKSDIRTNEIQNDGIQTNERVIPRLPENIPQVGEFIRSAMQSLGDSGFVFTDEEIENLCSTEWGSSVLKTGNKVPFMKLHLEGAVNEHNQGGKFIKNRLFIFGEKKLLIKTDIFPYSRQPFIKWYKTLGRIK